jgi:hypothetical protein
MRSKDVIIGATKIRDGRCYPVPLPWCDPRRIVRRSRKRAQRCRSITLGRAVGDSDVIMLSALCRCAADGWRSVPLPEP